MDPPVSEGKKKMRPESLSWVVAIDGGTTNTRARLLHEGQVIATARRAVGVRDSVLTAGASRPLFAAVRDAIREVLDTASVVSPDAIVAAGMLSSEVGLTALPHVVAPAGVEELARGARFFEIPEVADLPILIVPGVRTPAGDGQDGWAEADIMRGEECETFGALAVDEPGGPIALLWPGSHTKLVEVDGHRRIVRSHTTLAGEMTATLARQTLLAASLPATLPANPDPEALATGARIVAREGLGRCAFLVRVAALTGALTPEARAGFWIGAVIADDVAHFSRHAILERRVPVRVG